MRNTGGFMDRRSFVRVSSMATAASMMLGSIAAAHGAPAESENARPTYEPGVYSAVGTGRKSDVTVEVSFTEFSIESVTVVDHHETERIARPAIERIPAEIVEYQSLAVDAVTGATFTSFAILSAVEDCVEQAGGDASLLKNAPTKEREESVVEIESDLVVIGAGISGMAAALAASQRGAKVTVFEKSSAMGGNALVSGGFIEHTDAPEELRVDVNEGYASIFEEVLQFNREAGLDDDLVDNVQRQWDEYYAKGNTKLFSSAEFLALQLCMLEGNTYDFQLGYAQEVQDGVAWLTDMGYPWMPLVAIPGYSWAHFSNSKEAVNGEGYFNLFEDEMAGLSLEVLFETPAENLLVENGKVVGVVGTSGDGTTYRVVAKDAVIVASGGYSDNRDMLIEHDQMWNWEDLSVFHSDNNYGHTGDGIRMALDAGAAFGDLPFNQMIFPFVDTVMFATETTVGETNESLYVNKDGKRFCNEAGSRTDMTIALMEQKDGVAFQVVDHDSSMITDGKTHTGMDVEYLIERGILYRAESLEELADLMGVDVDAFMETVAEYNEMTQTYTDLEFGRSSFGPNAPLDTPPFYASPRTWAMHITMDGVAVDGEHRALDADGNPVPGLYVVGEAACGGRGVGSLGAGYAVAQALYGGLA